MGTPRIDWNEIAVNAGFTAKKHLAAYCRWKNLKPKEFQKQISRNCYPSVDSIRKFLRENAGVHRPVGGVNRGMAWQERAEQIRILLGNNPDMGAFDIANNLLISYRTVYAVCRKYHIRYRRKDGR